jgi:L-fuconolactonase
MPEQFWPILERNRFEGSVLIQPDESDAETDWALSIAAQHAFVKAVVGWADLSNPELGHRLDRLQTDSKLKGLFHRLTAAPDPARLIELSRRRLTLDLVLSTHQLSMISTLLDRAPDLTIVICHLGCPLIAGGDFENWARQMERVSKIPNVALKISGLLNLNLPNPWKVADLTPFVQHAIGCFGPDRLMFGSDWPACLATGTWKESLAAFTQSIGAHSIDFRENLLGGTAAQLYNFLT